jgi:hypothetical protein
MYTERDSNCILCAEGYPKRFISVALADEISLDTNTQINYKM